MVGWFQSDKVLYLATEYVEPLQEHLNTHEDQQRELYLGWGVFQITVSHSNSLIVSNYLLYIKIGSNFKVFYQFMLKYEKNKC